MKFITVFASVLVWLFPLPVHCSHVASFFVDEGNCKCLPYGDPCAMEVMDVTGRTTFFAKTLVCWHGTRLCCVITNLLDSKIGKEAGFVRGFVLRIPSPPTKSHYSFINIKPEEGKEHKNKTKVKSNGQTISGGLETGHLAIDGQILKDEHKEKTTLKVSDSLLKVDSDNHLLENESEIENCTVAKNLDSASSFKSNLGDKNNTREDHISECSRKVGFDEQLDYSRSEMIHSYSSEKTMFSDNSKLSFSMITNPSWRTTRGTFLSSLVESVKITADTVSSFHITANPVFSKENKKKSLFTLPGVSEVSFYDTKYGIVPHISITGSFSAQTKVPTGFSTTREGGSNYRMTPYLPPTALSVKTTLISQRKVLQILSKTSHFDVLQTLGHEHLYNPVISTATDPVLVLEPEIISGVVVLVPAVGYYGNEFTKITSRGNLNDQISLSTPVNRLQSKAFSQTTTLITTINQRYQDLFATKGVNGLERSAVKFSDFLYSTRVFKVTDSIFHTAKLGQHMVTSSHDGTIYQYYTSKVVDHTEDLTSTVQYHSFSVFEAIPQTTSTLQLQEYLPNTSVYSTHDTTYVRNKSSNLLDIPANPNNSFAWKEGDLNSVLVGSVTRAPASNVTYTGKLVNFSNTTDISKNMHNSTTITNNFTGGKVFANTEADDVKQRNLNISKTLTANSSETTNSRRMSDKNQSKGKSFYIAKFPLHVKPTLASEEFRKFLRSLRERKLNKTKVDTRERSGAWSWLFG